MVVLTCTRIRYVLAHCVVGSPPRGALAAVVGALQALEASAQLPKRYGDGFVVGDEAAGVEGKGGGQRVPLGGVGWVERREVRIGCQRWATPMVAPHGYEWDEYC